MTKVALLNFFRNIFKLRFLEKWLWEKTNDKLPDNFICKFVPNPVQYKSPEYRDFERNGVKMLVDISDYIGHYVYYGFKDPSMDKLFSLCRKGYNVLDVGTNIGYTLLNFSRISETGKVIGFEPDANNRERCGKNLRLNNTDNIKVLPFGLGESNAVFKMEVRTPCNRGGNRICLDEDKDDLFEVEVKRMDDIPDVQSLEKIDLIKIDVEGYELNVLKGSVGTLKKFKPVLFIELDDNNLRYQGGSSAQLVLFLNDLGYNRIINAENDLPIVHDGDFSNCHFDIVAYHEV